MFLEKTNCCETLIMDCGGLRSEWRAAAAGPTLLHLPRAPVQKLESSDWNSELWWRAAAAWLKTLAATRPFQVNRDRDMNKTPTHFRVPPKFQTHRNSKPISGETITTDKPIML